MAMTSISGVQSATSGLWAQMQQQQAQRIADQAEMNARSLQAQARDAQMAAAQAQGNARSLSVRADQASSDASSANMNLSQSKSLASLEGQFGDWHQQLSSLLTDTASVSTLASAAQSVLNADGQTTGALISVTA